MAFEKFLFDHCLCESLRLRGFASETRRKTNVQNRLAILMPLLVTLVATLSGCATHADRLTTIRDAYYGGRIDKARSIVDVALKERKPDRDVLKLERAMIELAEGNPVQAERTLREVRDSFDFLEQKDVGESVLASFKDDNTLAYAGEDYEKVLVRCFLALSSLMHDGIDAEAYALQVAEKQKTIIQAGTDKDGHNPKLAYQQVALGAYIQGALKEATHHDYGEAEKAIQLVASWEPQFEFAKDDLKRVKEGRHSEKGNGVLYVFGLIGEGPYKEERAEMPASTALLIADRILSATNKHSLPPTIAPIKVPVVVRSRNRITGLHVQVDGEDAGSTATIMDIGRMALEQYEAVFPRIMARAVVRRVVKKGSIYAAKEVARVDNPLAEFAFDAAGAAWEATESADTRCWGLLPDQIHVLRIELPAGEHSISLRPLSGPKAYGDTASRRVVIEDGRNTYLLANFPDRNLVGKIVVSGQR